MAQRVAPLHGGHALQLLAGSADYFAALIEAIDTAQREVRLETYIFDFSGSGAQVAWALEHAARRGVKVMVLVDGFGTDAVPPDWQLRLEGAGVDWRVFGVLGRFGVLWPGNWRRMHRKLCVVDEATAFCGGINILDDLHDPNHGVLQFPRFDFAVRVQGPLAADMHAAMVRLWVRHTTLPGHPGRLAGALFARVPRVAPQESPAETAGPGARAALVLRDNFRNRTRIERAYRRAIGQARREVIIANAYFVPGRKLRTALVSAARRGVKVQLLLQGRYEYFLQYYAARPVYGALLQAGVEIHEYSPSFLHAKVAVVDGHWATVGSSNLDPLSLLLAREANVMVEDAAFAQDLRQRLADAIAHSGRVMDAAQFAARPWYRRALEGVALGIMRALLLVQGKKYL